MVHELNGLAESWLTEAIRTKHRLLEDKRILKQIVELSEKCAAACQNGKKILFAGNGGSAADAQHLAGEFVSRFNYDRPGLSAFALTVDTSILTAIGNDYGYEHLFARQVQACAKEGDIFIGLSTSGNSVNVIKAVDCANKLGVYTAAFTGESGGKLIDNSKMCVCVPSSDTPRIQECHIVLGHILCGLVEHIIFPKKEN